MNNEETIKIVAISDTHGRNYQIQKLIDQNISGDIFIHAGDFTTYNNRRHFNSFVQLMNKLNFKHKIVIPGNHQILLDVTLSNQDLKGLGIFLIHEDMKRQKQIQRLRQANCLYFQHDYIQIENIKIFLSSYTPIAFYQKTGFQLNQQQMANAWNGAPENIDLLVTHGPPFQILDRSMLGENGDINAGSKIIREYLQKTKPKVHIFGHIHESKGMKEVDGIRHYNVAQKINIIQLTKRTD